MKASLGKPDQGASHMAEAKLEFTPRRFVVKGRQSRMSRNEAAAGSKPTQCVFKRCVGLEFNISLAASGED